MVLAHLPPGPSVQSTFSRLCQAEVWRAACRMLEVCRASGSADTECARTERWIVETVMCTGYAALISLHSSQLDGQIVEVATRALRKGVVGV